MANTKTRNAGKISKEATPNEEVLEEDMGDDEEDECKNDGDTSTSFSLEECMNEFRARRVRRTSAHSRHEIGKSVTVGSFHDAAEIDLINQNMCNKEQERKCKPCKDGFCYCFTSDSGEGSAVHNMRHSRRRRSDCGHTIDSSSMHYSKVNGKSIPTHAKFTQTQKTIRSRTAKTGHLTAISRLETSHRDAPLIHITQELRDNCVISEVRVNEHKIQSGLRKQMVANNPNTTVVKKKTLNDPATLKQNERLEKHAHKTPLEPHIPTAPILENISEFYSEHKTSLTNSSSCNPPKSNDNGNRRHKPGGRLLQKRLSYSNLRFKQHHSTMEPPPKPPRSSLSLEEKSSVSTHYSTSASVREAERVVDEFLAMRGHKSSATSKQNTSQKTNKQSETHTSKHEICMDNDKRNTYPLIPNEDPTHAKQVLATYPSLSDIERVVHSKKSCHYEKNISKLEENRTKVFRIGWNDPKIHDMLNYDSNCMNKISRNLVTQAEPQQSTHAGLQILPKIDIDTVDGIVRHNMASNIKKKDTPVKTELCNDSKLRKISQPQRSVWSEQLRNLSPWSKNQGRTEIRKSNLRSSSKEFLKSSKKKILRLVSPKKDNKERRNLKICKTPHRNVAIQTSNEDFDHHPYLQSPPGSYHSPMHSSIPQSSSFTEARNITANDIESGHSYFDFSRHIHSPPKKTTRSSQRKLNFPLDCAMSCTNMNENVSSAAFEEMKTYHSFNGELDQDVSLSKMSYILSNIRAKLEASDEHAVRTFRATEHGENIRIPTVIDDRQKEHETNAGIHNIECEHHKDPIYSEIEDDSILISESPNFENHTGIQHFNVEHNPNVLYALVDKSTKRDTNVPYYSEEGIRQQYPTALGKILQDALKGKRITQKKPTLSPLPEPPGGEVGSFGSSSSLDGDQVLHCHSMNNVRVMEHNSTPKKQRYLSKSDLSLHRSEIFLENLYRSELMVENQCWAVQKQLQKIENNEPNQSYVPMSRPSPDDNGNERNVLNDEDSVSYELPIEDEYDMNDSIYVNSTNPASNFGLNGVAPPSSANQSTPKKPSFITKDNCKEGKLNMEIELEEISEYSALPSRSCPNSPKKSNEIGQLELQHNVRSQSFNVISDYQTKTNKLKSINVMPTYKLLKSVLHKSFKKSKAFVTKERKRLSPSLIFTGSTSEGGYLQKNILSQDDSTLGSDFDLDSLLSPKQCISVNEQLTQVVNICRHLPDSEISTEMVEAERLLLFSELRRGKQQSTMVSPSNRTLDKQPIIYFFVDDMYIPIRDDVNLDLFFNYFYIVTFECGGIIRSTQSAECQNGFAVFRDCGIEFTLSSELNDAEQAIHCNIFMLRLRKVSTLSLEPVKTKFTESIGVSLSSLSASDSSPISSEICSRFRLHASFTLNCKNFIPYEYVAQESEHSDRICLRASKICSISLTSCTKSFNLSDELQLKGRTEVRFPKRTHSGFLNVEDPHNQHNWNRRWCTLDGMYLRVWQDELNLNQSPLLILDLRANQHNVLNPAPRDVCARPRSFFLLCTVRKAADESTATIFFAADTQDDLNSWLDSLNIALHFINSWL